MNFAPKLILRSPLIKVRHVSETISFGEFSVKVPVDFHSCSLSFGLNVLSDHSQVSSKVVFTRILLRFFPTVVVDLSHDLRPSSSTPVLSNFELTRDLLHSSPAVSKLA